MQSFLRPLVSLAPGGGRVIGGQAAGTSFHSLTSFKMEHQDQTEWCWAAVSASVASFFGSASWSQCSIASAELNRPCCNSPLPGGCNQPWSLDTALSRVGYLAKFVTGSITFSDVNNEISLGHPVGIRIEWAGGGAHFVAIAGWSIDPQANQIVDVFDPWYGTNRQVEYSDLINAYTTPGDSWSHTYLTSSTVIAGGGVQWASISPISA